MSLEYVLMWKLRPTRIIAALILLQGIMIVSWPLRAIKGMLDFELLIVIYHLVSIAWWLLLVIGAISLACNKRWFVWCLSVCALLSPVFGMPMIPFVLTLFPRGVLFMVSVVLLNFILVIGAYALFRKEESWSAT